MGTRTYFFDVSFNARDHPHAYGDKYKKKLQGRLGVGSSPRVWGQGEPIHMMSWYTWIIPTRMGTRYMVNFNVST